VASLAALWAVLTRLHRPDPKGYSAEAGPLVEGLTPYEKALLFDGSLPQADGRYSPKQLRSLREILPQLRDEYRDTPIFEGRFGASPREMREILYNAVYRKSGSCLTPPVLFEEMRNFVKDKSLYLFLQLKVDQGYHDAEAALDAIREEYLRTLDQEVLAAMELVPEGQYASLFERYFKNVSAFLRGEKVRSPATGHWEEPNPALMAQVEEYLGIKGSPQRFREDLLGQVASWTLENPNDPLELSALFAGHIRALSKGFHARINRQVVEIGRALLAFGTPSFSGLPEALQHAAKRAMDGLVQRSGYCAKCAPEVVAFLLEHRYSEEGKG
jgi:predicted Ser/Thr protein kinase